VRAVAGADPFVLLGHSAGGMLAHAIAERLEDEGNGPAGVVLLDTYATQGEEWNRVMAVAMAPLFDPSMEQFPLDENLLTMGAYWRLIPEWEPREIAAPGLFLRAAQPLGDAFERGLLPDWQLPETILEVPGDHFGVIGDCSDSTARAIDAWLADRLGFAG
jgi:pimeloyl-ACP methyl ester carboxylesterase